MDGRLDKTVIILQYATIVVKWFLTTLCLTIITREYDNVFHLKLINRTLIEISFVLFVSCQLVGLGENVIKQTYDQSRNTVVLRCANLRVLWVRSRPAERATDFPVRTMIKRVSERECKGHVQNRFRRSRSQTGVGTRVRTCESRRPSSDRACRPIAELLAESCHDLTSSAHRRRVPMDYHRCSCFHAKNSKTKFKDDPPTRLSQDL